MTQEARLWTRSAQIRGGSVAQIMASAAQICGAHGFSDFPLQLTSLWVIVHICSPDFGHCHSVKIIAGAEDRPRLSKQWSESAIIQGVDA